MLASETSIVLVPSPLIHSFLLVVQEIQVTAALKLLLLHATLLHALLASAIVRSYSCVTHLGQTLGQCNFPTSLDLPNLDINVNAPIVITIQGNFSTGNGKLTLGVGSGINVTQCALLRGNLEIDVTGFLDGMYTVRSLNLYH